jgi:dihydroflavonol-4-reductase
VCVSAPGSTSASTSWSTSGPIALAGATTAIAALPRLGFAPVDVRDVAAAHRVAIERPAAVGGRYILSGAPLWLGDIAGVLADEFRPRGYRVPGLSLPSWLVRLGARRNPTLRLALPLLDTLADVSSARAGAELGWTARPVRDTIVETAESLIACGEVHTGPGGVARRRTRRDDQCCRSRRHRSARRLAR